MSKAIEQIHMKLENGTVIRHKVVGYEGRIDGVTEIKACFTKAGHLLDKLNSKETFQYRVMVEGRRCAASHRLRISRFLKVPSMSSARVASTLFIASRVSAISLEAAVSAADGYVPSVCHARSQSRKPLEADHNRV